MVKSPALLFYHTFLKKLNDSLCISTYNSIVCSSTGIITNTYYLHMYLFTFIMTKHLPSLNCQLLTLTPLYKASTSTSTDKASRNACRRIKMYLASSMYDINSQMRFILQRCAMKFLIEHEICLYKQTNIGIVSINFNDLEPTQND